MKAALPSIEARSPERLAEMLAAFVAGLNLLFLLTFLFTAISATKALPADRSACGGTNLIEQLKREAPDKLQRAIHEASQIPNSRGLLWRIEKNGGEPSYLFGTMHSADPRIARLEKAELQAFEQSEIVIVESTDALDKAALAGAMAQMRDLVLLPEGSSLESLLPQSALAPVKAAAEARGLAWAATNRLQPWMVAAAIANPQCEMVAAASGAPVLDQLIADRAKAEGKSLAGLETIEDQFTAVAAIPQDFHVNALAELAELGSLSEDITATTKILYLEGNIGMILPLVRTYAPRAYSGKGNAEFQEMLINRRNAAMAANAEPYLAKGNAFIAVGAMHLPGKDGLVELFRQAGYRVEPVRD
jgi:uncharacterized protein